jgi:hypothetical protein
VFFISGSGDYSGVYCAYEKTRDVAGFCDHAVSASVSKTMKMRHLGENHAILSVVASKIV